MYAQMMGPTDTAHARGTDLCARRICTSCLPNGQSSLYVVQAPVGSRSVMVHSEVGRLLLIQEEQSQDDKWKLLCTGATSQCPSGQRERAFTAIHTPSLN